MLHLCRLSILPLLALIAGVAALYIDPKESPRGKKILLGTLLLVAAGTVVMAASDDTDKQREKDRSDQENQKLESTVLSQAQTLSTIRGNTEDILTTLAKWGWKQAAVAEVQTSLSADLARKQILPQVQQQGASRNITITYYPKQVDGAVVVAALKEGGFVVHQGTGNASNKDLPTNAIWVGDSVPLNDAKFVALTLARAGVGIKAVRRFRVGGGAKSNLIEVGTDNSLVPKPSLTVDQIQGLPTLLPRDSDAQAAGD